MQSETIYIPLLNEGTRAWRPVVAQRSLDGTFRILGEMPDDEEWAYKPGDNVVVKQHVFSDGLSGLIADRLANEHTCGFQNWAAVEHSVAQSIAVSPVSFDPAAVSNVQDFLHVIRKRCPLPEGVAKGYWGTIRVWWDNVEVEIFDDHFELYRFGDDRTQIEHFDRAPGTGVPADLVNLLPRVAKRPD
jgi:hypothetical protein